jgi:hypothetical protein
MKRLVVLVLCVLFLVACSKFATPEPSFESQAAGLTNYVNDIAKSSSGTYVSGFSLSATNNLFANKFDVNGNLAWSKAYDTYTERDLLGNPYEIDTNRKIVTDKDGNVYITGEKRTGNNFFDRIGFLKKLDANGNTVWTTNIGGNNTSSNYELSGTDVTTDLAGNVYVLGTKVVTVFDETLGVLRSDVSYIVKKFNQAGSLVQTMTSFAETYLNASGYGPRVFPLSVRVDPKNNVYIFYRYDQDDQLNYLNSLGVVKLSPTGQRVWGKIVYDSYYQGTTRNLIGNTAIDSQGNVYLAVRRNPIVDANGACSFAIEPKCPLGKLSLRKFDTNGGYLWTKEVYIANGAGGSVPSIDIDSADNVYLAAMTQILGTDSFVNTNIFSAKYDSAGNRQWRREVPSPSTTTGVAGVAVSDGVYITGSVQARGVSPLGSYLLKLDKNTGNTIFLKK